MVRIHPGDAVAQIGDIEMPPRRTRNDGHFGDRRKQSSREALELILSAAPEIQEYELTPLLREVDEIADALKSGSVDLETLNKALREAVLRAVKQLVTQREFRTLALTDDLTGLYNRRGFLAAATQQLKLAYRESRDSLLFFADVDGLKQINDSYGHSEGDLALFRVAVALEQTFRESDIVARLGGDEFIALALNTSPYDQDIILRRLRMSLLEASSSDSRYVLALSVGVARFDPLHPISLGELVTKADESMYQRKPQRTKSRRGKR